MYDYGKEYDYDEQNYKEDYEQEILEIIEKVVAEKVEQDTKAFMKEKEQIQKNTEKKVELNNTIRNLGTENSKLEKKIYHLEMEILNAEKAKKEEIEKIKIDFGKDYLKTVVGEWKEGDRAYFIKNGNAHRTCPNCTNGKTTAILSNGKKATVQCDFCDNNGTITINHKFVEYKRINHLGLYFNNNAPFLGFSGDYNIVNLDAYKQGSDELINEVEEYNDKQDLELKERYEEYKKNNI